MSDHVLPKCETRASSAGKWLIGLWVISTVMGTTIWWIGLAWAAVQLAVAVS